MDTKNFKNIQISQHWSSKRGVQKNGQLEYYNPLTSNGKSKITSLKDVQELIEFFNWTESVHYKLTNDSKADWGTELYQINSDGSLSLIHTDYDSSD